MTTIFAFSDSHNREIEPRLFSVMCESDFIFFLGDGLSGVVNKLGDKAEKLRAVKGNCDGFYHPEERVVEVEDVRFLLVHGHRYHDKLDLLYAAKERVATAFYMGTRTFSRMSSRMV
jgi:Predicted phosphoesterase